MNHKQDTHSKIVRRFAIELYTDILGAFMALILILGIPIIFSSAWTPDLIAEEGYFMAWVIWFLGIMLVLTIGVLLVTLIYTWVNSRWEKAKKSMGVENGRK